MTAENEREALALATRAEAHYRQRAAADPTDATVRMLGASVVLQCRLPFAGFVAQSRLVRDANALLEEALAIDDSNWIARYTLAVNHFHTPDFLAMTDDAIREFERLVEQQGDDASAPLYATTYQYLGDLYLRRRRAADAMAIWRQGAD